MMNKLAAILLALSACASEQDGALHISGRLADPSQVTHVIAANPLTGEHVVVDVKDDGQPDGRFTIALPVGEGSWVVTFANASKTGAAMRVATLQSAGLDAFSSKDGGALDFGTVTFSDGRAHGITTWDRLEKALGADKSVLEQMAQNDDLALRYSNPDIDGNGQLDALEGHDYRLDIAGNFRYRVGAGGRDAEVADLVKGITSPRLRYTGTTIKAAVPQEMGMSMLSGTMMFDEAFYGTALGLETPMVGAGQRVGQPHIMFGSDYGSPALGVVAHPARNAPRGTYRFGFDNGQLTFTDVAAPSVEKLASAESYAVPFVRIRATNPSCTVDCDIKSVDLEWMRGTGHGWEPTTAPSDAHIDILVQAGSKSTYLATNLTVGVTSQEWAQMPLANTGLVRNELAYISTSKICYLAVSYTSELGMKMTGQFASSTCK